MAKRRLFSRRSNWDLVKDNVHVFVTVAALIATVFAWNAISDPDKSARTQIASRDAETSAPATPPPRAEPMPPAAVVETPPPPAPLPGLRPNELIVPLSPPPLATDAPPAATAEAPPLAASPALPPAPPVPASAPPLKEAPATLSAQTPRPSAPAPSGAAPSPSPLAQETPLVTTPGTTAPTAPARSGAPIVPAPPPPRLKEAPPTAIAEAIRVTPPPLPRAKPRVREQASTSRLAEAAPPTRPVRRIAPPLPTAKPSLPAQRQAPRLASVSPAHTRPAHAALAPKIRKSLRSTPVQPARRSPPHWTQTWNEADLDLEDDDSDSEEEEATATRPPKAAKPVQRLAHRAPPQPPRQRGPASTNGDKVGWLGPTMTTSSHTKPPRAQREWPEAQRAVRDLPHAKKECFSTASSRKRWSRAGASPWSECVVTSN
jgi:hypothetical protein